MERDNKSVRESLCESAKEIEREGESEIESVRVRERERGYRERMR